MPTRVQWEVRDEADLANVDERSLLPGLQGRCAGLQRHDGPGPGVPDADPQRPQTDRR